MKEEFEVLHESVEAKICHNDSINTKGESVQLCAGKSHHTSDSLRSN
jgi:hypothetical protein